MTSPPTVLVVEDDAAIRRGILDALRFHGFHTLEASTGEEGLSLAIGGDCQLVLLDVVLPGQDGFVVLRGIQEQSPGLPVILLTARGDEEDRVRGLRLGADDYVVKPFSIRELMARVDAVLRRGPLQNATGSQISIADGTVDFALAEVRFADGVVQGLSDREVRLLRYFSAQGDRIITRDELLHHIWNIDPRGAETRSVDMQIARLREKLRDSSILATIRGKGYRWMARSTPR